MLMQFCGLGVGHKNTWQATCVFRKDICAAFNVPDLYEPDDDADNGDDDVEMSDVDFSSWPPSPASDSQSSESLVDDTDVEEWEDVSSDSDPEDVDEDGSDEEGWCDEDDNPVEAEGGADDVEALGFSQL
ncbi:uncharacterized protein ARMOST_17687 [Armillaria ostoyae]|uniref:Uncharacterized protein n=1 Tax=Armillaria ostoyae TaxID=47428 RepID=A0A284RZP8_ARMOS|nr:uncharacterized protein ARMOST_17687 [Armillaria ostoyae]